jgi:SAM-dependent methyltransferase
MVKSILKRAVKLWQLIERVEQLEERNAHLEKRNKRLRQRIEKSDQKVEHLTSAVDQSYPNSTIKDLQDLSQTLTHQMMDCHQVLIDHKHQISNLQYQTEHFSPLLSIHPSISIHPPIGSAQEELHRVADETQRHQHLRDLTLQLGKTAQAQYLQNFSDTDLWQFIKNDAYPLPVSKDREGYSSDDQTLLYWMMGLGDYLLIKHLLQQQGSQLHPGFSLLDLGCASGRVLRHFAAHESDLILYGADINRNNIAWARKHLPSHVTTFQNTVLPQLPLESNSLDLVYGCSLFTHIDEQETTWLLEIKRVLKPGGIAFFTIHSDRTWNQITPDHYLFQLFIGRPHEIRELNITTVTADLFTQEMPYDRIVFAATDVVINNTNVFHSIDYIKRKWSSIFEIIAVIPNAHGEHQDGILMIKRP